MHHGYPSSPGPTELRNWSTRGPRLEPSGTSRTPPSPAAILNTWAASEPAGGGGAIAGGATIPNSAAQVAQAQLQRCHVGALRIDPQDARKRRRRRERRRRAILDCHLRRRLDIHRVGRGRWPGESGTLFSSIIRFSSAMPPHWRLTAVSENCPSATYRPLE
jgi:hypothetical protein